MLLVLIGLAAIGLIIPTTQVKVWVGSRDVDFSIRVEDNQTHQPIEGAVVNQCEWGGRNQTTQTTDAEGVVHFRENLTCAGKEGHFVHTMSLHIPERLIWVTAPGYTTSEAEYLRDLRPVDVHHERTSSVSITIRLGKKQSQDSTP
jgi:hypothetical protein